MKKTKYIITTLFLSLTLCNQVHAYCTQKEKEHFKEVESKYKITYEFDETTKNYNITYYMPESPTYIYDIKFPTDVDIDCKISAPKTIKCTGKNLSNKLSVVIKGNTKTCNEDLKTEIIELKKNTYNKYSESELCKDIEDFVLCQPNYDKEITQEEFESRVETYKKSLENKTNEEINNENNSDNQNKKESSISLRKLIDYIQNNITTIAIIIVFIVLAIVTILLTAKNIKKSRRLE